MSIPLNVNGTDYFYPQTGDVSWGPDATDWAVAVTSGMLQKAGGLFQLLAEVDFGPNYGLKSVYFLSRSANPANAGSLRLARPDVISWRNDANNGNLDLSVNSSDQLLFNGSPIGTITTVSDTNSIDLTLTGTDLTADLKLSSASADPGYLLLDLSIEADGLLAQLELSTVPIADTSTTGFLSDTDWNTFNAKQPAGNYITSLTGDVTASGPGAAAATIANNVITNVMVNSAAAISYSKLALSNSIVNSDINTTAAIALSKLANITANTILGNNTGSPAAIDELTPTEVTAMLNVFVGGAGAGNLKGLVPRPATDNSESSKYLKGDGTWDTPPSTLTFNDTNSIDLTDTSGTITADLNLSAASPDTGNINAISSIESDGLQVQVPIMVGDTGTGGAAGVVPAPAPGDELKFLRGDGTWQAGGGGGGSLAFAFGAGTDGDVTVTSPITLSRDMFYNNLTISGSGAIETAGYRIFVKAVLDLTAASAGSIKFTPNNGTNNSTGTSLGQTGAATINPQTVGGSSAGGAGGAGGTGGNGATGSAGTSGIQGSGSGAGGKGGNGGTSNGGAQGAGVANSSSYDNFARYATDLLRGVTQLTGGAGGRGGSGAGLGSGGNGGGGPGGGGGGGVVFISAYQIRTSGAAASAITALGGNGGTITFGTTGGSTGGPGGGGGGGGGWVYLCYGEKLDAAATNLIDVSGGTGGAGGNSVSGNGGDSGGGGGGGRVTIFCIADGSGSSTFGGNAVAPNPAVTTTGGAAQPGESTKVSF